MTARSFIFILIASFAAACGSESSNDLDATRDEIIKQKTTIQWIDSARDFGNITEGQKLAVSFRFRNTGSNPLVIESVHPSCGCTVADYPKEPIAPGKEGEVTGEFNSEGREGKNHKEMTVYTNTEVHTHQLVFDVNVIGKPQPKTAEN